jgi:CheY-like chemotaxis protein
VIVSYAGLLLESTPPDDPQRADLEEIRNAGERAAELTRQLLAFSRQQVTQPAIVDLNAAVVELERMLRRLIGESIELRTFLEPALGRVKIDRSQLEQVVANLVVNARDAMPGGGRLTIETANTTLDGTLAPDEPDVVPGPYVMLAISDTGVGMDAATRTRIFEPFFTTKELGRGTGLGLSTVYGIVHQAGGLIWVYSEPGRGTTFKIYLPRTDDDAVRAAAPAIGAGLGGDESILVVEDDPLVRDATLAVLKRVGYRVTTAASGADALRLVTEQALPLDLAITDLVMPGMTGRELAERLAAVRPGLRMIFMSGYTGHTLEERELDPGVAFLAKPFLPDTLLRLVRQRLDEGGPGG